MPVTDTYFDKGLKQLEIMNRSGTMLDQKALYEDVYRYSVGFLFGEIWNRPHLSHRDRQLITLAANIALSRPTGTPNHYRSAKALGISHEEIMELIIHVGMYAGWPCIAHACKQYTDVLEADKEKKPARKAAARKPASRRKR
jgi:alkylhydroperoxidase/carboxymuconolactone decarboxylase family protein YurZ